MDVPERDRIGLEYLERQQIDAAGAFGANLSPTSDQDYLRLATHLIQKGSHPPGSSPEELARTLRETYRVPNPDRWSRYEIPDHRLRLWRAEETVMYGMHMLGRALPSPVPALGTLPTFRLNAEALPVSSPAGYAVAIESGFFSFTAGWANVLAGCLLPMDEGILLDRFVDLCFCEVMLGTAAYLDERPGMDVPIEEVGEGFSAAFEAFMLAHEYAHIALGHRLADVQAAADHRQVGMFAHAQELEADAFAFEVVRTALGDDALAYITVAGYWCALHLIERGQGLIEGDPNVRPPGDSHPPAIKRRENLYEVARRLIRAGALQQAIDLVRIIEDRTAVMWKPLEHGFWRGRDQMPEGWVPSTPMEKSAALLAFKVYCFGMPG